MHCRIRTISIPLALAVMLLAPSAAQAHLVTTGLGPVYDGIGHFAMSPGDWLPVIGFALLAGMRGAKAARWALFILPVAWILGGGVGLHYQQETKFPLEWISFMVIGLLVAIDRPLPADVVACIAIALGLMHGYFNGAAMSAAGPFAGSLQLIGVSAVLFVMIAILSALVVALKPPWTRIVVRVAGSWIAAMGLLLLGWLMRPGA